MNKDSIEFTGHNIYEVVKFIDKNKEKRQDVPFMKLLKEGCDVFIFWIDERNTNSIRLIHSLEDVKPLLRKGDTRPFSLRMEKGNMLTPTYRIPTIPPKCIKFTGKNIIEIVQFIEDWKEMFIAEGYTIYGDNEKIKSDSMDIWWDCDRLMINLDNLKDGKSQVDGETAYNIMKGGIWRPEKEDE